ncbi:CRISPR-associated endonuclease Cas1 [Ferrovum myxofaciens]|uniref:CRISPR-associated endonuclease Cas1 n=1 Tax=Ferrovum myxofaciens TaxID=416213 RepID=A0A9E6MWQ3_9PROT|nr:CRISPR-associated endonuclease Cas1 [Ferrovum myxofaciens]MBU6995011.1 CRISPR-associated endonuclease Cas1 [Ferrovum myxofaciens]QKE38810.1 MAG: CRISPR-associated endonuclease Cas1 [Ferrovum myxofaciens]QKE41396.1 MAG: CRISPR-associated endonuclease Cas1 [Ferrovum myxofaciens]QWY74020.1 MAG: CRISPR-associated endonuclease Cas1 [Ferrovum myxofaciens]QWY76773.1 MAG: CRISPR-associated endonuclease Cas1 [Ferrovum myxofaciens]
MSLLASVLSDDVLFSSWERVRQNQGSAGVDGVTLGQFGEKLFGRLITLRSDVESHHYQPYPLLEIHIPKKDGRMRRLCIPVVRDRILQTAAAQVLTPLIDAQLETASFAYRQGHSVKMAVVTVTRLRDQGFQWVVDADITSFFDNIDHSVLRAKLKRTVADYSVFPLIELWLAAVIQPLSGSPYLLEKGVPQGSPISPLLANLYLDDFDENLMGHQYRLVRFADDFLILCRERQEAENALELTTEVMKQLKLELQPDKTRITHFNEGFRFLGVDFIRNLLNPVTPGAEPWVIPDHYPGHEAHDRAFQHRHFKDQPDQENTTQKSDTQEVEGGKEIRPSKDNTNNGRTITRRTLPVESDEEPEGEWAVVEAPLDPQVRTLILTGQGLYLQKENDRLLIGKRGVVVETVPFNLLDQIVLQGNQMISSAVLRHAAGAGVEVFFADHRGTCVGALDTFRHNHADLHRAQFLRDEDGAVKLMLARAYVQGKLHNTRVLLRRYNRRRQLEILKETDNQLGDLMRRLPTTLTLDQVRGTEGQGAHVYFTALKTLLPAEWNFTGRNRRPPADPFNLLISYGYGILFSTVMTLVNRRGLNPYLGALHALRSGHPALVSDLVEEFRAPIVDTVALYALLDGILKPQDFVEDDQDGYPCRMEDNARRKYLTLLQTKFRSAILHPRIQRRMDYHRAIQYQVYHYARIMLGEETVYEPFILR